MSVRVENVGEKEVREDSATWGIGGSTEEAEGSLRGTDFSAERVEGNFREESEESEKIRFAFAPAIHGSPSQGQALLQERKKSPTDSLSTEVWSKCLQSLRKTLAPQLVQAWIEPLHLTDLTLTPTENGNPLTGPFAEVEVALSAPNKFSADHIQSAYGPVITNTLADVVGAARITLRFRVGEQRRDSVAGFTKIGDTNTVKKARTASSPKTTTRETNGAQLNPKYNFSNYVVGSCNQFAHAVGLQVSENLGSLYNPLFIYGGVGLGKTHLVNAIGNATRRRGKNALMISSEAFVNELISSLRSNKMPQFKTRFRSLDLLIIDDIQFIMGKERTQEEFFHTFNELYQQHKQIIITSDKTPQELTGIEERLRTRFAAGISADLQAPDLETRIAIVTKKAEGLGVPMPFAVAELLAERIDSNVRELEGALNRVIALSSLRNVPVSLEVAEHAVRDHMPSRREDVSVESIQKQVAERYSVSLSDLLGKRRTQNIAFARQVSMYLCRRLTACSFPEIGALFGGRDHSTVIHAVKVIEEKMLEDGAFKRDIEHLSKKVTA